MSCFGQPEFIAINSDAVYLPLPFQDWIKITVSNSLFHLMFNNNDNCLLVMDDCKKLHFFRATINIKKKKQTNFLIPRQRGLLSSLGVSVRPKKSIRLTFSVLAFNNSSVGFALPSALDCSPIILTYCVSYVNSKARWSQIIQWKAEYKLIQDYSK